MRRGSKYALKSLCCLGIMDFFGILGVALIVKDPNLANSLLNGFVGTGASLLFLAVGITVSEWCCCPQKPEKSARNEQTDADLDAKKSPPKLVSATPQTYKYQPVSDNGGTQKSIFIITDSPENSVSRSDSPVSTDHTKDLQTVELTAFLSSSARKSSHG